MRSHLKRYAVPKSWHIARKKNTHIARPLPGAHSFDRGTSISYFLKQEGLAETTKEVKVILRTKEVLIDGVRVRDFKHMVGFLDIISIPEIKFQKRVVFDAKRRLVLVDAKNTMKVLRVTKKTLVRGGKTQLNCSGGRNFLVDKAEAHLGDSLVVEVPKQKIVETLARKKGATVYLTGGSHVSSLATVEDIKENRIWYKIGNQSFETKKEFALAIPKAFEQELKAQ